MNGKIIGIVAREVMGRPDAHLASIECLYLDDDGFDGVRVGLADAPLVTRGKRAGQPNWRAATNKQIRLISTTDLRSMADAWSARTGLCLECVGEGRTFKGWSLAEGTRWAPCRPCNATGSTDGVTVSAMRETELFEATS